ncbi:MAG: segregation/condensation protein A [Thermodesulfovibrionales bacterium]|nr:segregation/condensation protein A [Thermodesulfovibrionales bacterium]
MSINVALPLFEGPLDLLLHLIRQNKIDIYDIPIALITKQYLEYLDLMKELDLEVASEFLIMAANLIYIKSRMLLPKPEISDEEEEDPRKELVEQLVEYSKFKEISQFLKERYDIWSKAYPRKTSQEEEFLIQELNVFDLLTAFKKIVEKPEPKIYIIKESIKVEEKIEKILEILRKRKTIVFDELFQSSPIDRKISKMEIIVTFLALLELLRLKLIKAYQNSLFNKIFINLEEGDGNRCDF